MANNEDQFKKVISHAKEYGYIFGSSEIYDGLSAVYDYAQNGGRIKKEHTRVLVEKYGVYASKYCGLRRRNTNAPKNLESLWSR